MYSMPVQHFAKEKLNFTNCQRKIWDPTKQSEKNWHPTFFRPDFFGPHKKHSGRLFPIKNDRPLKA